MLTSSEQTKIIGIIFIGVLVTDLFDESLATAAKKVRSWLDEMDIKGHI